MIQFLTFSCSPFCLSGTWIGFEGVCDEVERRYIFAAALGNDGNLQSEYCTQRFAWLCQRGGVISLTPLRISIHSLLILHAHTHLHSHCNRRWAQSKQRIISTWCSSASSTLTASKRGTRPIYQLSFCLERWTLYLTFALSHSSLLLLLFFQLQEEAIIAQHVYNRTLHSDQHTMDSSPLGVPLFFYLPYPPLPLPCFPFPLSLLTLFFSVSQITVHPASSTIFLSQSSLWDIGFLCGGLSWSPRQPISSVDATPQAVRRVKSKSVRGMVFIYSIFFFWVLPFFDVVFFDVNGYTMKVLLKFIPILPNEFG